MDAGAGKGFTRRRQRRVKVKRPAPKLFEFSPQRRALETQLALHVLLEPELSRCVPPNVLSPLPELLIDLIALAPTFCREIGVAFYIANCFTHFPDSDFDRLQDYLDWLATTPRKVIDALPPFDDVLADLERATLRLVA